ncbi:hypothetical protein [Psychrobacter sp. DM8]|uniref:hypothetical protein n=1 Tax=Psychrobacter sp. DM8 TaxID=3440636 RepID=UPI003F5084C4
MIDGIWWLVILLSVAIGLWLFAKSRGAKKSEGLYQKSARGQAKKQKIPINDSLQKTALLLKQYFPDYVVKQKANHLLVSKQDKKIAMITIDKKLAMGQRRLGEVPVINYHRVPSRDQLAANLQDAQ